MALIAIHAVVHVAGHALVILVGLRLQVAVGAGEDRIIVGVGVARTANTVGAAVRGGEPGVIEGRVGPDLGVMASRAGGREPGCSVVRVVGALVIRFVTAVAVGRQGRPIVVDVAVGALARWHGVGASQRESRLAVVKS